MISEAKINQVLSAIRENGIKSFDTDSLVKLLSILNKQELEVFKEKVFYEENGLILDKFLRCEPLVTKAIDDKLYKIGKSELIILLKESISKDLYYNYLSTLTVTELADVRYYIANSVNPFDDHSFRAAKKMLKMITEIIKTKELNRKPSFDAA
jgi:hypothetical protein